MSDDLDSVAPEGTTSEEEEKWPFLFMLTIALVALYVGYRVIQMIVELIQWLT